jgi:hypothetical protein
MGIVGRMLRRLFGRRFFGRLVSLKGSLLVGGNMWGFVRMLWIIGRVFMVRIFLELGVVGMVWYKKKYGLGYLSCLLVV